MTMTDKKDQKSSSKSNLNESTLPLLEDPENVKDANLEKGSGEPIEMETKNESGENNATGGDNDGKKKKKEKKVKEPKEKKERITPLACAQNFTVGLNVIDRDDKRINSHVNLNFDDIIGEVDANQGFEFIWRLTFLVFTTTRLWLYRIIAGVLAIPLALIWAVFFAIINISVVWILTPVLRIYDLILHHVHRVWAGLVRTFLDPLFISGGLLLGGIRTRREVIPVDSAVSAV